MLGLGFMSLSFSSTCLRGGMGRARLLVEDLRDEDLPPTGHRELERARRRRCEDRPRQ